MVGRILGTLALLGVCIAGVAGCSSSALPAAYRGSTASDVSPSFSAIHVRDYLYVVDRYDNSVLRFALRRGIPANEPDVRLFVSSQRTGMVTGVATSSGVLFVAVKQTVRGKNVGRVLAYDTASGGTGFPLYSFKLEGVPESIAADTAGNVYAGVPGRGIYMYPPHGSDAPVRHIERAGTQSIAVDRLGNVFALRRATDEPGHVDVFSKQGRLLRTVCTAASLDIAIAISGSFLYVAGQDSKGGLVARFQADESTTCAQARHNRPIRSNEPGFTPRGIWVAGDTLYASSGKHIELFDADRIGLQRPVAAASGLRFPDGVVAGSGSAAIATARITVSPLARNVILPPVAGFRERMLLPAARAKNATVLDVTVSSGGTASPRAVARFRPNAGAYSPVLSISITAEAAALLVNSPGFTIAMPTAPPGNEELFLSIYDPANPDTSWLVGPGVYQSGSVNFSLGATGTGISFNAGDTYEFQLFGLPVTTPTPTPLPTSGNITEFPIKGQVDNNVYPIDITNGPDGNEWFTVQTSCNPTQCGYVGRISPTGVLAYFPSSPQTSIYPFGITVAAGSLWFAGYLGDYPHNGVAKLTTDGAITPFPVASPPPGALCCYGLVQGPDGETWGAGQSDNGAMVFQFDLSGNLLRSIALPGSQYPSLGIAVGADGALWTGTTPTNASSSNVYRITTDGAVTTFSAPSGTLRSFATGADGNIWYTDGGDHIDRVTTAGAVTAFFVAAGAATSGITSAPDGTLWFTECGTNQIGHMSTTGTLLGQYFIPTPNADPLAVTVAKDGTVWFTENLLEQNLDGGIGKLSP